MRVRPRRPAPYLNAADQRRMLALVGALAVTLFSAKWAADPNNWHWIAPPVPAAPADGVEEAADFSVNLGAGSPRAGTVRAVADVTVRGERGSDGRLPTEAVAAAEDRSVGLSRAERGAAAAILGSLEEEPLAADDAEPVAFPALMRDPAHYRGRPVTVAGLARGVRDLRGFSADANDAEAARVGTVEVWLFLPDGGDNPVRAVANRAAGLPRGDRLSPGVPVELDGYFFKLEGYAAESGLRVAPLILTDEVRRATPAAAVPQTPAALPWAVLGVCGAALAGGGLLVWRWKAGDRAYERSTLKRMTAATEEDLALSGEPAADPAAFLAGLSGGEAKPAGPGEPGTPS